jgi:hypothetical protein
MLVTPDHLARQDHGLPGRTIDRSLDPLLLKHIARTGSRRGVPTVHLKARCDRDHLRIACDASRPGRQAGASTGGLGRSTRLHDGLHCVLSVLTVPSRDAQAVTGRQREISWATHRDRSGSPARGEQVA